MQPIDKKPMETPPNVFYGVDVNNRLAVEKEFKKLKWRHRLVTMLVIIFLIGLGGFVYDYIRVTELGGKPIFVIEEKVVDGTKFKGLGYEVLYCNNGDRFVGPAVFKKCGENSIASISDFVYKKFVDYAVKKKMLNLEDLDFLEFNLVEYDEENEKDGGDYHINLKYACKSGNKCLKLVKEYESKDDVNLYLRLDKYNDVFEISYFKNSGVYYDKLKLLYRDNLREYLIKNDSMDSSNIRSFDIELLENHGMYKFRGTSYSDSYLVRISYMCVDNSNVCVKAFGDTDEEGDYANLTFYGSMFIDSKGKVLLFGPKEYFDL